MLSMANFTKLTFKDGDFEMDVNYSPENNNIWMLKEDVAFLYEKDRTVISRHIKNIYQNHELIKEATCAKNAQVQLENGRSVLRKKDIYNLNVIIKVGEKVNSNRGILLKYFLEDYLRKTQERFNEVIIYNKGDLSLAVNVSPEEDTVWLSVNQIAILFDTSVDNVYLHIKNIYSEGEIDNSVTEDSSATRKEIIQVAADGKSYLTSFYNLDLILAVGYRVKSKKAIEFRRWASKVLKQYLLKGYALDNKRVTVSIDNIIALENDVKNIKEEIKDIKEKVFIEPIKERLFFSGQYYDAYEFLSSLMMSAKKSLIIIDPYFDAIALKYLKKVSRGVTKKICKSSSSKLSDDDIAIFTKQYGEIFIYNSNKIHGRFIIIDEKDTYSLDISINGMGNKLHYVRKIDDEEIIQLLVNKLNKSEILIA